MSAANSRNRAREAEEQRSIEQFSMTDLAALWDECGGCCAVSGLTFGLQIVGNGQAKRPFAPSLDRIDRHKPYQRDNLRLVVSIANFAMNAWGDEPLLQLASAVHLKSGDRPPPNERAPADGDLDVMATIDAEFVDTDVGTVVFPPRPDMRRPLVDLLRDGPLSSQTIEDALAQRFCVTEQSKRVAQAHG